MSETWVNDLHSQLNPTLVRRVLSVEGLEGLQRAVALANEENRTISVCGGRHAGGAQQFATDSLLVDTRSMNRVLRFDRERGLIEVEAGILWPQLIDHLWQVQTGDPRPWGIAQKQTGADDLSLGGAVSSNIHSRGLRMKPFIADVEALTVVNAEGNRVRCSRDENPELFGLAAGGYGLFGIIYAVTLRLVPRRKIRRRVCETTAEHLMSTFEGAMADGCLYGDFQFSIDDRSEDFLNRGIFAAYQPVEDDGPIPDGQRALSLADWSELVYLAHADKATAYAKYRDHYLSTDGHLYWSDTHQNGPYQTHYHQVLDTQMNARVSATEILTELYVPRASLPAFLEAARRDLRERNASVIYGTIRLIERDDESFLAWAKEPYACIIFNLHTPHDEEGLARSAGAFRTLIDRALELGGCYYLTYHKFATVRQLETAYPQFREFLRLKKVHDPAERFQSDWYRHYKALLGEV